MIMTRRGRDADQRGREKFYQYHNGNGHLTEKCVTLKKDIECLIQGGHLRQFVTAPRQETPAPMAKKAAAHNPPVGGFLQINTIIGGLSAGGTSSLARKAYSQQVLSTAHTVKKPQTVDRPPLCFYDSELRGILSPHNDALIIMPV